MIFLKISASLGFSWQVDLLLESFILQGHTIQRQPRYHCERESEKRDKQSKPPGKMLFFFFFFFAKVTLRKESKDNRNAKGSFITSYTPYSELLSLLGASPKS